MAGALADSAARGEVRAGLRGVGERVAGADPRRELSGRDQVEHLACVSAKPGGVGDVVEYDRVGQLDARGQVGRVADQDPVEDVDAVTAQRQLGGAEGVGAAAVVDDVGAAPAGKLPDLVPEAASGGDRDVVR